MNQMRRPRREDFPRRGTKGHEEERDRADLRPIEINEGACHTEPRMYIRGFFDLAEHRLNQIPIPSYSCPFVSLRGPSSLLGASVSWRRISISGRGRV